MIIQAKYVNFGEYSPKPLSLDDLDYLFMHINDIADNYDVSVDRYLFTLRYEKRR